MSDSRNPDVGRKLANDFVAQAQTQFGIRQARAHSSFRIILTVEIGFRSWLEDQPIGSKMS